MIVLDFACGLIQFCKSSVALLQQILALSVHKFEDQVFKILCASSEVRDTSLFITIHTEKEPQIFI